MSYVSGDAVLVYGGTGEAGEAGQKFVGSMARWGGEWKEGHTNGLRIGLGEEDGLR